MIRFSANLGFLWADLPLLDRIDAAARAGFRAVEFHYPYDVPARDLRAACGSNGLIMLGLNTVAGNAAMGEFGLGALPGRERDFMAAVDQAISYCSEAGGTSVHALAGVVAPEARAAAREVLKANLAAACEKAAAAGLTILVEPINPRDRPNYFYSTTREAAELIEEIAAPNLRLMFDVYHVAVTEGDVITKLRRYSRLIGHVQIAAVPSRAEPDEGEISYRAIFEELDKMEYGGWIGCEYRPRAGTEAGLGWTTALGVTL